jgi:hypothetical protein
VDGSICLPGCRGPGLCLKGGPRRVGQETEGSGPLGSDGCVGLIDLLRDSSLEIHAMEREQGTKGRKEGKGACSFFFLDSALHLILSSHVVSCQVLSSLILALQPIAFPKQEDTASMFMF